MKVAVIYNTKSERVINVFGTLNQERYGKKAIERIVACLKRGGHQVRAIEGDKDLIEKLEDFMPRVIKGERPGMAFNLAYGIQGQARYTHVPGILEMVGIPYVGSGPMAHSLALDKVIAKMIFVQHGLPTPEFAVLQTPEDRVPDLRFPLIVKPRNEAVSFGIKIVNDEAELRAAAGVIFEKFQQPVLVERFIKGREVNVGLIGNRAPEALPPAELIFGEGGPQIYTYEDKTRKSGRTVSVACPADLDEATNKRVQELAIAAFDALGCLDCARVDMRLDEEGNPYILEINSLPSLGEHGSYVVAAEAAGLDFCALVNRLVEVASSRYFATPEPDEIAPEKSGDADQLLEFVTSRRERIERRIEQWTRRSSRTGDTVGLAGAFEQLDRTMTDMSLRRKPMDVEPHVAGLWETAAGLDGGTLLIGHLDVPLPDAVHGQMFHREPEHIIGEGIGSSRAPLVAMEFALQALRSRRQLSKSRLGVLYYGDEGRDCAQSAGLIRAAAARAKQVLVLRPGNAGDQFITQRRGVRRLDLRISGPVRKLGQATKRPEVLRWSWARLEQCCALSSRKDRVAVSVVNMRTSGFQNLLPHEVSATILINYLDAAAADRIEAELHRQLEQKDGLRVRLTPVGDRPPFLRSPASEELGNRLRAAADRWEVPFAEDSSLLPSVAGLAPASTAVICGVGPSATETFTSTESVERISVVQRTLLLAQFLLAEVQR
ncbi:MAG: D-alanine-D-alanine ligase [Planctomycetota bacterium]|jgi:D-alanine-D-alanine ligase